MSDLKIQGVIAMDATDADQAFARVDASAKRMAQNVARAGDDAAAGIARVGEGAAQAAQGTEREMGKVMAALKRAQRESQRALVEAQGHARGSAEAMEAVLKLRGVDTANPAIRQQIDAIRELRSATATLLDTQRRASAQDDFIEMLKRQTAAIGKSRADLLELEAAQLGVGTRATPMIAQLRAAEQGIGKVGISAAQTAAALRGVPAQFTDIVTSLQGGMNPLTVFMQQGGQLKDMFGGAGAAAKALSGYVLGLVNPFSVAAAGVGVLTLAYYQGTKEADAYRKALVLTGNAAGTTAGELQAMAVRISQSVGTQGAAAEALAQMAGTGQVARANLQQFSQVAVEAQRSIGTSVGETVKHLEELGRSPVEASLKLTAQYRYLSAATYEQIRALRDQGRTAEAASLAQSAYAQAVSSRAAELKGNLGSLERGWAAVADAAKGAWNAMLNVGRPDTAQQQLEAIGERIERIRRAQAQGGYDSNAGGAAFGRGGAGAAARERELQALLGQQAALQEMARLEQRGAEMQARKVAADEAGLRFSNLLYEGLSKQEKLKIAIAQIEQDGLTAGKSRQQIEQAISVLKAQDRFRDSGAESAAKREQTAYAHLVASIKAKIAQNEEEWQWSGRVSEADRLRAKLMAELESGAKTLTAAHRAEAMELIKKLDAQEKAKREMKANIALYQQQAAAAEEAAQAAAAADAERKRGWDAVQAYSQRNARDRVLAEYELTLLGKTERARERAVAQKRVELELADELEKVARNTAMSDLEKTMASAILRRGAESAAAAADARSVLSAIKDLDSYLDPARATDFGTALRNAFGEAGNALAQLTNSFQNYVQQQAELAKMQEALRSTKGTIDQGEYYKREQALARKSAQSQIGSYAAIAGAAKGFFSEHSKGYRAMEAAEKAFRIAEMALAVESMTKQLFGIGAVASATVTAEATKAAAVASGASAQVAADLVKGESAAAVGVATQAEGDPYTAFARMAAMAAAMAALGFAVAGAGSGSSASAAREKRQATQGTGTVFGDSSAKSTSIGNAVEILSDGLKLELRYQSGMAASLRNIEDSMAGVANAVLRTAGITTGAGVGVYEGVLSTNKGDPILSALGLGGDRLASSLPGIGGVIGKLQSLWGKTKQEITDSGLVIQGIVADLSRGQGFSQYTDVRTTSSSFFGLSKSTSDSTIFSDLDAATNDALARVFRGLSSSLALATAAFGRDAAAVGEQIAGTLIDIPRTSLRDLKGQDLADAIASVISAAADTLGQTVMPGLEDFQQVGEGYFETIIRVSTGVEQADYALERFGITAVGFLDIASKQGDVAAEIFRDSVAQFEGAGAGITQILQGVSGSVDDLAEAYSGLVGVRNALKSVGAQGTDPSYELLRGAGGLEALQDGLDAYLQGFFSGVERHAAAADRLAERFATIGVPQPADIAAFRALASSLDQADAAGAQLFGQLMGVADAFYDVANAVQESERALADAFDGVAADWLSGTELQGYRAGRISQQLAGVGLALSPDQILGMSADQFKALYEAIDKTTMAGREQAMVLLDMWGAFKSIGEIAADVVTELQDAAMSALERAANAQRKTLGQTVDLAQEALTAAKGMYDMLDREIAAIRGDTATAAGIAAARQFISQAAAGASATGSLPDADELSKAISTARSGLSADRYATQAELEFNRRVLAGDLEQLQTVAGKQKSIAQQQLDEAKAQVEQLDALVEWGREQLDVLRGIDTSILTVADALAEFMKATGKTPSGAAAAAAGGSTTGGAVFGGGSSTGASAATASRYSIVEAAGTDVYRRAITDESVIARLDKLSPIYHAFDGTGDLAGLAGAIQSAGGTVQDLAALSGYFEGDWRRALEAAGIPAFARGTNYVPFDTPALVHQGERIVPAADNRALIQALQGGGDAARLESLLAEISGKLDRLEKIAASTGQMADQFDSVSEGGNAVRMEAMA